MTSKIEPHKQRNNRRRAKKHSCGYPLPVYNSKSLVWKGHHESENWIFNRQTEAAVLELTRISLYSDMRCYDDDCYNKLWKLLIDKNMKKKDLRLATGMSTTALAKLGKNQHVSTEILMKICTVLDCDFCDIIELVKEENHD